MTFHVPAATAATLTPLLVGLQPKGSISALQNVAYISALQNAVHISALQNVACLYDSRSA